MTKLLALTLFVALLAAGTDAAGASLRSIPALVLAPNAACTSSCETEFIGGCWPHMCSVHQGDGSKAFDACKADPIRGRAFLKREAAARRNVR